MIFILPDIIIPVISKMADEKAEDTPVEQPTPEPKPEPAKEQKAPESKGKGLKIVGILIVLAIVLGIIGALVMFGDDLFDMVDSASKTPMTQAEMVEVGTPGATATLNLDGAKAIAEEYQEEDNEVYTYCKQLNAGDKISTLGDYDKYDIKGPTWLVYVDEDPFMFFEHEVKYVFVDAATGEKTEYTEGWPPEINDYEIFEAAEENCPEEDIAPPENVTFDEEPVDNVVDWTDLENFTIVEI